MSTVEHFSPSFFANTQGCFSSPCYSTLAQANYSAGDIADMNTADALGDLEFTVRAKLYPLECATPELKREAPYDCTLNVRFPLPSPLLLLLLQLLPAAWLHCRMVYCCSFRTETLSRSVQIIMLTWALLPMPMTSS